MSKRKYAGDDEVLKLIYHIEMEQVECVCGEIIQYSHSCQHDMHAKKVIQFIECVNCEKCKQALKQKDRWYEDRDGYVRCSKCDFPCGNEDKCRECHESDDE